MPTIKTNNTNIDHTMQKQFVIMQADFPVFVLPQGMTKQQAEEVVKKVDSDVKTKLVHRGGDFYSDTPTFVRLVEVNVWDIGFNSVSLHLHPTKSEQQQSEAQKADNIARNSTTTHEDFILGYPGIGNCESCCRVRIYCLSDKTIVILNDISANQGTYVTNAVEKIATKLVNEFAYLIHPEKTVWIEAPDDVDDVKDLRLGESKPNQLTGAFLKEEITTQLYSLVQFDWIPVYSPSKQFGSPIPKLRLKATNPRWKHIHKTTIEEWIGVPLKS